MHSWLRTHQCLHQFSLRNNKPSSLRQREARHQRSKIAAPFTAMRQARSSNPRRSSPPKPGGHHQQSPSIHEEPLAGRCDHLAAHGALPQLLAAVTVAAHHVAARHQDHGWTMLVADGTRHAGATRGWNWAWGGGSCIVNGPFGGHCCTVSARISLKSKRSDGSILEAQLCQNALELLLQAVWVNIIPGPQVGGIANLHGAAKLPLMGGGFASRHELLLDLSRPNLQQSLRLDLVLLPFNLVPLLGLDNVPSQLLSERHGRQGTRTHSRF